MARNDFNEATRVQLTALVHLTRIGYTYLGKIPMGDTEVYDPDTNILKKVFEAQFKKLNPKTTLSAEGVLSEIRKELDDDDLGRQFYKRLISVSPVQLVDFEHPENNTYHCTAEFTCKNDDEFRPDITLFINGLPLVFIEVKKPNNVGGMVAESKRMNKVRFPNKKFRRFINITQLMIFSNNMEYDAKGGVVPVEGVFYCTAARSEAKFNCFREENPANAPIAPFNKNYPYAPINSEVENRMLVDLNVHVLSQNPEYRTNLDINTPTNRVLTSMVSPERLLFLFKYGIAYLHEEKEDEDGSVKVKDEKHIMRYQQMFAALAIREKLKAGVKSGVVWHTQGSGKTALSFHLTKVLKDYYASQNKVARFYFIVDRLDLLQQASEEFSVRGLKVATANSRDELMKQFRENQALQGNSGKDEITVVNIQKFEKDTEKVELPNYATNLQRVFIMDEAHRGYKPEGCFLSNLFNADKNAIKIALTGTPLIGSEKASCKVFGDYFHTYYYDRSIQDGYTLKIIREEIETSYRKKLTDAYENAKLLVQKGIITKNQIIEHDSYIKPLLRYIINDMISFRTVRGDDSLGGMVICETSTQARNLYAHFDEILAEINSKRPQKQNLKAGLVLYDSGDKEEIRQTILDFKKNFKIDILIVFNMLLTGFDAPRLKRLYFGRKIKDHNLLQAITRVNRPYKNMKRGFLIDFADIKADFEETNKAYLRELNRYNCDQNGNDDPTGNMLPDMYQQVMEDKDALIDQMKLARQALFNYTTDNAEAFSTEISSKEDKAVLIELRRALELAKDAMNLVRTFGDDSLKKDFEKLNIEKLPQMLSEVNHRIAIINQKEAIENEDGTRAAINVALLDIEFDFNCIGTDELKIIDNGAELRDAYSRAVRGFLDNFDHDDPEYISIEEAFYEIFKKHGFAPADVAEYNEETKSLNEILKRLEELRKSNEALLRKYNGDTKFAYVHKRIREENKAREPKHQAPIISKFDEEIVQALLVIKNAIDKKVYDRNDILKLDAYFGKTVMTEIANGLAHFPQISPEKPDYLFIQQRIAKQYINQYNAYYGN